MSFVISYKQCDKTNKYFGLMKYVFLLSNKYSVKANSDSQNSNYNKLYIYKKKHAASKYDSLKIELNEQN